MSSLFASFCKRQMLPFLITITATFFFWNVEQAKAAWHDAQSIKLDKAEVVSVDSVPAGKYTFRGGKNELELPEHGVVKGIAKPTADSLINFEVWLPPAAQWNNKLLVVGNGGYSPFLKYDDMADGLKRGYAVVAGDTGHQGDNPGDLTFGVGHPEKIIDWGTRSIHAITVAAKPIVTKAQGRAFTRAYYKGCSTGGQQGFAEVQRYPEDFDGVIAGAPGHNRIALNVGFMWQFLSNHRKGDNRNPILTNEKAKLVTKAAIAACDSLDGVTDGLLNDPRLCTPDKFDVSSLQCKGEDRADCLTAEQVAAVKKMYAGPKNLRTGEQIYPGWPVGTEAEWPRYWGKNAPTRSDFWSLWVFNKPDWDWWTFDFDKDLETAYKKLGNMVDQTSPDLGKFKSRGGKLIVWTGWADAVVNPLDTIAYYEKAAQHQGGLEAMDSFARMYLVPGMAHCRGGTGTDCFDLLGALDAWVDKGQAPGPLPASRVVDGKTVMTRPLCPYPQQAQYIGSGDVTKAENYICK